MDAAEIVERVVAMHNMIPAAHIADPRTAKLAALRVAAYSDAQAVKVLWALIGAEPKGMTYDELEAELNMRSAKQRLTDLKTRTLVVGTGATRETRWGSPAEVYRPRADIVRQVTGDEQTTLF